MKLRNGSRSEKSKKSPFVLIVKSMLKNSPLISQILKATWSHLQKEKERRSDSRKLRQQKKIEAKKIHDIYKKIIKQLPFKKYDYLIFAPWLVKGGADKYTIDYANTICKLRPNKKVLVITTLNHESPWISKLDMSIGRVEFGNITHYEPENIKNAVMLKLLHKLKVSHIHNINSEFSYNFIQNNINDIKHRKIKIILSAFSRGIDELGHFAGYAHTNIPPLSNIASLITSDNQAIIDIWKKEYGINRNILILHRQPIELPKTDNRTIVRPPNLPLKVLWASRIAYEKQPQLLAPIGQLTEKASNIDIYGSIADGFEHTVDGLPSNMRYIGSFDGFCSIPIDKYDLLLYTSLFDGMPNILLEAAQNKLPIIASNVGGISEFIIDNKTGLLINDIKNPKAYADAIIKVKENPRLLSKFSNGAYEKLKTDFSPEKYTKNISDMLKILDY